MVTYSIYEVEQSKGAGSLIPRALITIETVYIEGLSNKKAAAKLFIDPRTFAKRKALGLTALAEMYSQGCSRNNPIKIPR